MSMRFEKWHGTGNDFIMVLDREATFHPDKKSIAAWCQRKFGIGADGLIIIRPHDDCDFQMIYYNADGGESTMCGNGGRCAISFANKHGLHDGKCTLMAIDGEHTGIMGDGLIQLEMNPVASVEEIGEDYRLNTGSPHYVRFDYPGDEPSILEQARAIRNRDEYLRKGINVNFVKLTGPNSLKVRTYERGVEDETFSCGTGVVASAICAYLHQPKTGNTIYGVTTPGGQLQVRFKAAQRTHFSDIWLKGPATHVFSGQL